MPVRSAFLLAVLVLAANARSETIVLVRAAPDPTKLPVADFTASATQGGRPLEVVFTDLSSHDPDGRQRDFGDGGTSGLQHPSHTYVEPGRYPVSMTAMNEAGSDTWPSSTSTVTRGDARTGSRCT